MDPQPRFDAAVAMSGGVDSSVAAAILVEQGMHVIGVTLKLWHARMDDCDDNLCCSADSVESARRTCRKLGIDHIVLNAEREFRESVVDDFIDAYSRGMTPNPCVMCNPAIKFGELHRRVATWASLRLPQDTTPESCATRRLAGSCSCKLRTERRIRPTCSTG